LGKGSFGEVVKAVWKATGTAVAIKRLLPFQGSGMSKDPTAANMVAKEALVWSRLQHPHILPLLGVCLMADVPFLVMPLMAGGDLPTFTKDKSAQDQLRALHETAQGVAYLHSQKIFHGDLKGNNVLVDEYGRVQVSDFGQSRVLSMAGSKVSTFGAGSIGNVRWIAPERYEHGAEYQFEPDVFGFAMVMYEVLSGGKIPFQEDWRANDDVIREWYRQGTRPTAPASGLDKFGTADVWEVVQDCWQQDWKARPTMVMVVRKLAGL
ncbi:kinase-like domain-containing protein, partial [Catenaria anguillulae PL171]